MSMDLNILQAIDDPAIFGPAFRTPDTWKAWRAFLSALFALADGRRAVGHLPRVHEPRRAAGRPRQRGVGWSVVAGPASPSPSRSSPSSSAASATGDRSSALASAPR